MASSGSLALATLLVMSCAYWAAATTYTVGDTSGWTTGMSYSSWTSGKTFVAGDKLAFNYAGGLHTVDEVTAADYAACSGSNTLSSDSSGSTTITLKTAGTHYFICSTPGHCSGGMKLQVTAASASSPSTPTTPTTPTITPPSSSGSPSTGTGTPTATKTPTPTTLSGAAGLFGPKALVTVGVAGVVLMKLGFF